MSFRRVSKFHLLAMGLMGELITTANWNLAEKGGLGFQIILNAFAALAFVIFFCCMSELSSALPFPGGNYAFARCTAGFYPGYLAGCIEIFYNVLALGLVNASITEYIVTAAPSTARFAVVIILVLYISQFLVCLSKRVLYDTVILLAIYAVIINLVFIFGAFKHIDFNRWAYSPLHSDDDAITAAAIIGDDQYNPQAASASSLFAGGGRKMLGAIAPSLWIYQGLEYINLMTEDVEEPRRQIPFAQLVGIGIVVFFYTTMPILASSMSPGTQRLTLLYAPTIPGNMN
jgi:ethanolamine permease